MIAYKFLAAGAIGPLSRVAWPAPGVWLEAGEVVVGRSGAHLCRPEQLAHWLHDELWRVEADGAVTEGPDCVVVARARLVERVAGWTPDGALRFARACVEQARAVGGDPGFVADAAHMIDTGYPAIAAYCAAIAIAAGDEDRYAGARAWQSTWLAAALL